MYRVRRPRCVLKQGLAGNPVTQLYIVRDYT